jgi:two-component system heavy metal sensor histidine kinase CusS
VKRLAGFATDLAHDLRTPLNALMLKSEVALSRPRSADEYQALLASNMEEYQRLSRLIENTLFLARAENAQLALRVEPIELGKTLGKIGDYFSGLAEEAGISINVDGGGIVLADPVLLDRALSNLIANALRYSTFGTTVRVDAREDGAFTSISVENRGPGIPEKQIERVFDPYYRGDTARADDGGSAGIGLAIVRAIMKLHGGSAEVTSGANGLTRFTLKFPQTGSVRIEST